MTEDARYLVVCEANWSILQNEVNKAITLGYVPQGGIAVTNYGNLLQALYKPDEI